MSRPGKMPFTERALAQLTLVRFREFIREPEALFWVFIFPVLLAGPGPNGAVVYAYDPTNPEGRTARMLADRAVERAAGRIDPVASTDRLIEEPGSRYIDFLIPGLVGMNLMGSAIWGIRSKN